MSIVPFYYVTTISGVQYELSGNVTTKVSPSSTWQQIRYSDNNSKISMAGLFRFRVGETAVPAPVWSGSPSPSFVFGVASSVSFLSLVTSSLPLTFTAVGPYPPGMTINSASGTIAVTANVALGTYNNLQIRATDTLGQSSLCTAFTAVVALGTHSPVWSSLNLWSVQQGSFFNLNSVCSDQDAGDSLSFTALSNLPAGISLNQSTGVLSIGSSVPAQAYSVSFRATDLTARIADSGSRTLSVIASSGFVWNQSSFNALIDPTITSGPLAGLPIFTFFENTPSSIDIGALISGSPTLIEINRPPAEEFGLDGITFDTVTKRLVDVGRPGIGACIKFQFTATDGVHDVPDEIIPYDAAKPWIGQNSGPMWRGIVDAKPDGNSTEGNGIIIEHSMLNNAGQMSFENLGLDWWDINMTVQGSSPWVQLNGTSIGTKTGNLTTLAKAWERGDFANLGVILIGTSGTLVNFARSNTATPPTLTITWTDGSTATVLTPAADCELNSTYYGVQSYTTNNPTRLQVSSSGTGPRSLVFFDFTTLPRSKRIATATLSMNLTAVFGSGTVNVFAVRWQAQDNFVSPDAGLAINYPNDVGIETDPNVIQICRWDNNGSNIYGDNLTTFINTDSRYPGFFSSKPAGVYGTSTVSRQAIIATTDPVDSTYAPPASGMSSLRLALGPSFPVPSPPSATPFPAAGNFFDWCPFAILLDPTNPLAGSGNGDLQNLYISFLMRLSSMWEVEPIGGHSTGIQADYKRPFAGTDSRTGRARSSALLLQNAGPVQSFQTNSCAVEDLKDSSRLYTPTFGSPPPPPLMTSTTPMCADPWNYRNYNLYAYSPVQPGSTTSGVTQQGLYWDLHARGALRKKKWYQIELHFKANTFNGSTPNLDGIHESWINGRRAQQRLNWATVSVPGQGVTGVNFEIFGPSDTGGRGSSYGDVMVHISNIVFAKQRIGLRYFS